MSSVVKFPSGFDDEAPPPPPPDEPEIPGDGCPVGFLGTRRGNFFFFNFMGEDVVLTARKVSQGPEIKALFGPSGIRWLNEQFKVRDEEGKVVNGKFNLDKVNLWIIGECGRAGLYNANMPRRGVGVWKDGDAIVLHCGDQVRWGETWRRAGFREGDTIWLAQHAVVKPARAARREDVAKMEAMLRRWNWRDPFGAELAVGLWACGLMGAAISWRPHGFIVGGPGTGKSTLFKVLNFASVFGKKSNDYSKSGIEQTLSDHAGPVFLDEADPDDRAEQEKLQRVIAFIRKVSGDEGAEGLRGSPGGEARQFHVVASFIMGGTLSPVMNEADVSRITKFYLDPLASDAREPSDAEMAAIKALAPAFLSRAVDVLPRFQAAYHAVRAQILSRDGGTKRAADQVGALLAARWIMLHDGDVPNLEEELSQIEWALPREADREADGGPRKCWNHLLHSGLESYRKGDRPTVRSIIVEGLGSEGVPESARRDLFDHGMRIGPYRLSSTGPPGLYVMNTHPRLATIFAGSRWEGGRWSDDLARLPGAIRPPGSVKLAKGEKHRCVWVPADLMPSRIDFRTIEGDAGDDEED